MTPGETPAGTRPQLLDALNACTDPHAPAEIVVCARRRSQDRYRLPLANLPDAGARGRLVAGEVPRASADPILLGGCGIFQGQRRCDEADAAEFGYGRGRDPVTFVGNLVALLTDPDAEVAPPPRLPAGARPR